MMPAIEDAILRTVLYADIFQFALTPDELHRGLIHTQAVAKDTVRDHLNRPRLQNILCISDGYIALAEHAEYISRRKQREALVIEMDADAQKYGRWLARIPFVRMVALTGALAAKNPAHAADDLDYLLVTAKNRVWLTRAMSIILVRLLRLRKIEICPNFVLSEEDLLQGRQDLYIARELAQMKPIFGQQLYAEMWASNDWLLEFLPNSRPYTIKTIPSESLTKRIAEVFLRGFIGNWLETWEYQRKVRRFKHSTQQADSAAIINKKQVKGHFQDHGHPILNLYLERLRAYDLDENYIIASPKEPVAATRD